MDKLERRSSYLSGMLRPALASDGLEKTCMSEGRYGMAIAVKGGRRSCRHVVFDRFDQVMRKVITQGPVWYRIGEIEETEEDARFERTRRTAHWG
ncbi:hypothetical protein LTR82_003677 [Friedmanniomyces endolithicus]|uniref:Uncharacterized protein n=1 Tax=Friedmanniomyces endolithicus TaxID=329885 RepID=A0AAN6FVW5_9PEZI|nr:hypothetical protein LTR82_003677 [Friedmanniomyces endolithicus]